MAQFLKNSTIKTKIFVMLTILFFFVGTTIVYSSYFFQKNTIQDNSNERFVISEEGFYNLESRDTKAINSVLNVLLEDEKIKELYVKGNREELYEYSRKRFVENKDLYGITHWYFIDLNDNVFLRMHSKDIHGDEVDRITFNKSKSSGNVGSGIELGKTAFALRVVAPYYKDGQLIGYMELAQEIDHLLNDIKKETSLPMAIVVKKTELDKQNWNSVRMNNDLRDNWNDNENFVVVSSNIEDSKIEYDAMESFMNPESFLHAQESKEEYFLGYYKNDKRIFSVGEFHLRDASGKDVGSVYIAVDNSDRYAELFSGTVFLILSTIVFYFIFMFIIWKIIKKAIINPLKDINKTIREISFGNYKTRLQIKTKDEIGEISRSFNKMVRTISDSRLSVDLKIEAQTSNIRKQKQELENQQRAMLNVLSDVEQEKEKAQELAEDLEKFKLAVDNASDHIAITDTEGKILYGNKAVERITGYLLKDVVGFKAGAKKNWGGNMSKDFYEELWRTIKVDKKVFSGRVQNIRKNGEKYYADVSISPVLDEKGSPKFFVAIERDITKEVEIDKAKTEFVSLASHQLRTPLTAIKWNVEMLLDIASNSKVMKNIDSKEIIQEVYSSNQRMIDLVNALLNVSRIDLGTFAIEPENINPKDISEATLRELDGMIKSKGLKVSAKYDSELREIFADPKLLTIVIQNLLSNAIKYTLENGKVEIIMKKEKKSMLFSVKDSGMGIPLQQQSKIFSKLFRAENAVQKISDGTGLGLYVAKAVIEQSGGEIWFESIENKGTTFTFKIPLSGMKKKEGAKGLEGVI